MQNNLFYIVQQFLISNNYTINEEELNFQLEGHPNYPSLYAVTELFTHFSIENLALEIPTTKESMNELPNSFLTVISNEKGEGLAMVTKSKDGFTAIYNHKRSERFTNDQFLVNWSGITLMIEPNESKEKNKIQPSKINRIVLALIAIFLTGSSILIGASTISLYLFITSLIGLIINHYIIKQELGIASEAIKKLCTNNEKTNCNAVLNSKGATLFGKIKLSDLGMIYFFSLSILIYNFSIFSQGTAQLSQWIVLFSIFGTLYSLFYQGITLKKWCPLCLGIIGLLWAQAIGVIVLGNLEFSIKVIKVQDILITLSLGALITIIWTQISSLLKKSTELKKVQIEFSKFRKNFNLFKAALSQMQQINLPLNTLGMQFGNSNAPHSIDITIVSNPLCSYCKDTHKLKNDLLKRFPEHVNINYVFLNRIDDTKSETARIAASLLTIYQNDNNIDQAMDEIYVEDANIEQWLDKWEPATQYQASFDNLKSSAEWAINQDIKFTPTLIIDGYAFPNEYEYSDLLYFIEDLLEEKINIEV
ncbi:vitamin K epoxide reductase family protein [Aureibacter tunicatorum]|uniref:Membrane protein/predicted DsbA family dithiol-disulfide isomerase n=1 Tax=Aureibacter tunicatorum TaxID=866807 RepID=A0AAE4BV42_9BACT|nr:vitamin K epoxide reductase family protein [Aureibacter tunicatorum]MDR6241408.1 putative membrane protein/predicted DsbA family dithiol-disulfide isomerase [Aureibacter tunicatorum]BDD06747.1 hypothetical protein AUTU_42300 [Aureibacter tunicatorum]